MGFKKASKARVKVRLALIGPSGSGKTYSALLLGSCLGSSMAVIDTEQGSASRYADKFDFDVLELTSFSPKKYIEAIEEAKAAKYEVLIIDSLSHAWMGKDGALDQVNAASKKSGGGNSYTAWKDVTPQHNQLVDAMLGFTGHIIVTMRAKTEYVIETNERGKSVPRKIGMAAVQRDGLEYEFDVVGDMTLDHDLIISKSRCSELAGEVISFPGADLANRLLTWASDGISVDPISPEQIQELTDTAINNGYSLEEMAAIVKSAGFASRSLITVDAYPELLKQFQVQK